MSDISERLARIQRRHHAHATREATMSDVTDTELEATDEEAVEDETEAPAEDETEAEPTDEA